jgi:DNA polymerase
MEAELLKWYLEMGLYFCLEDNPQNHMAAQKTQDKPANKERPNSFSEWIERAKERADNCNDLVSLANAIRSFRGCELSKTASNTVFSDGDPSSKIMLIGEAPGFNEDIQGIPFCGASGTLLNKMLSAIGLKRKEVYISNAVFWRPPNNRKPSDQEINLCRPFVQKHIALIYPEIILLLGGTAVTSLLERPVSVASLRGQIHEYSNQYVNQPIKLIATYHPSYLLRQPEQKKLAWNDMLLLKQTYQQIS